MVAPRFSYSTVLVGTSPSSQRAAGIGDASACLAPGESRVAAGASSTCKPCPSASSSLICARTRSTASAGAYSSFWYRDTMLRGVPRRSEEHTSELHNNAHLVCRLLLENKNNAEL